MILLGYLHQGGSERKPSTRANLVRSTGINEFDISRNNRPLAELGMLERTKSGAYRLTPEGMELARSLEFEEAELTKRNLAPLLTKNETIGTALNTLRIRGPMPVDAFLSHVAMSAGEPKTNQVLTGARAILDFLVTAGLVELEDDRVQIPPRRPARVPESEEPEEESSTVSTGSTQWFSSPTGGAPTAIPFTSWTTDSFAEARLQLRIDITLTGEDLSDPKRADAIFQSLRKLRELGGLSASD